MDDPPLKAIQFHTSLLQDVEPVARETLCRLLLDHEREYLPAPVHLERIDSRNC